MLNIKIPSPTNAQNQQVFKPTSEPPGRMPVIGPASVSGAPSWDPAEEVDAESCVSKLCSIKDIFPNDYKPPVTLLTAIKKISKGSTESGADSDKTIDPLKVTQSCNYTLYTAVNPDDEGEIKLDISKYPNMTIEEAKTITSYTYNAGNNPERAPFKKINAILRTGDEKKIKESIDMIYMLIKSFRKLPLVHHPVLFRGIDVVYTRETEKPVEHDDDANKPKFVYKVGQTIIFDQFTSTSTLLSQSMGFLKGEGNSGTVFVIEDALGYDLKPFSMYSFEGEILLDIESKFKITKIEENVTLNRNEVLAREKNDERYEDVKSNKIYNVTRVTMKYVKTKKLPLQESIYEMTKKEDVSGIPNIAEYKKSEAPHAPSEPGDERIVLPTSSGKAFELNMRTGETKDIGSTLGLPKGWVEMKEIVKGVEVKYYTNGEKKQYERPQNPQFQIGSFLK